jgi:hypothetical protein
LADAEAASNGHVKPAADSDKAMVARRMSARDIDPDLQVVVIRLDIPRADLRTLGPRLLHIDGRSLNGV